MKVDSDEHFEEGTITEDLGVRNAMMVKRLRKEELIRQAAHVPEVVGNREARVLVIGWGSTYHAIREAVEAIGSDDLAFMHLQQVYPLHPDVERRIRAAERVVLVEGNATAQLGRLIRTETGLDIPGRLLKYSGMQFSVEEVREHLEGALREVV